MRRFIESLSENLFGARGPETRGQRVFFGLFEAFVAGATLWLAWTWGFYIGRISDVVLPLGIAQYVDVSFLFEGRRALVNAGVISLLVALGRLRVTRWAYAGAFVLLHLQYAARYSLGEIPHSANLAGMALLALALAMVAFRGPGERRRFTMGFTYFFIGLGYTISGVCKLVGTGLTWPDGVHLWMWIHEKGIDAFAKFGVMDFNLIQELALNHYWVATAFLLVGLLTELSAFLMWWRRFRLPVGVAVLGLHTGIYAVMGILFWLSMIELALLTFPWARWIDAVLERTGRSARAQASPHRRGSVRQKTA